MRSHTQKTLTGKGSWILTERWGSNGESVIFLLTYSTWLAPVERWWLWRMPEILIPKCNCKLPIFRKTHDNTSPCVNLHVSVCCCYCCYCLSLSSVSISFVLLVAFMTLLFIKYSNLGTLFIQYRNRWLFFHQNIFWFKWKFLAFHPKYSVLKSAL